jgi:hypothetical protein
MNAQKNMKAKVFIKITGVTTPIPNKESSCDKILSTLKYNGFWV